MAWGCELEFHGLYLIKFSIASIKIFSFEEKPNFPIEITFEAPIQTGPNRKEEEKTLREIGSTILSQLSSKGCNFDQVRAQLNEELFCNLYGWDIVLDSTQKIINPDILNTINISIDHGAGDNMVFEWITLPFGRYPNHPYSKIQRNIEGGSGYLQGLYQSARDFLQLITSQETNTQVFLRVPLHIIKKLQSIRDSKNDPWNFGIQLNALMKISKAPPPLIVRRPYLLPQFTTGLDLTYFSSFMGTIPFSTPITTPDSFMQCMQLCSIDSDPRTAAFLKRTMDRENDYIRFSRRIVWYMSSIVNSHRPHQLSDYWIEGAIGLGIWAVLSLSLGTQMGMTTKSMWFIMPKTSLNVILDGAYRKNPEYYIVLLNQFFIAYEQTIKELSHLQQNLKISLTGLQNIYTHRL